MNPNELDPELNDPDSIDDELTTHVLAVVDAFVSELQDNDAEAPEEGGMPGMMNTDMALNVLRPLIATYSSDNPEETLKAVARIHLETGRLLEVHRPDQAPLSILNLDPDDE